MVERVCRDNYPLFNDCVRDILKDGGVVPSLREMISAFIRMWDLYLSACAATFHNGIIDLHQILMSKGINNDLPMVRW